MVNVMTQILVHIINVMTRIATLKKKIRAFCYTFTKVVNDYVKLSTYLKYLPVTYTLLSYPEYQILQACFFLYEIIISLEARFIF